MERFYITTPIYYVNDVPHLGHAYTTVAVDVFARYQRARRGAENVRFLTGTDEHGLKIQEAAEKRGERPIELADRVVERFRAAWRALDISNDDFIRTTEPRHKSVVIDLWRKLEQQGDIYLGDYEGWYCISCEEFYPESQLVGGTLCPVHEREVTRVKEQSYFFRLSKYQEALISYIEQHPGFVQPTIRKNEVLGFLRSAPLRDLSISRTTFDWGIPAPDHPGHVIYVWIDALTNYLSALGGPGADGYKSFWEGAQTVHLIGKDILRFHCVYWPAMLLSAGLPLPRTVFAHGWWSVSGKKISKSLPATRIDPVQLSEDLGADALRYFLMREVPLGADGDFSYEGLIARINSELANDLGNLLNRSAAMLRKYVGGAIPAKAGGSEPLDVELAETAARARDEAARALDEFAPSRALDTIWELVRLANRYVDQTQPWTLAKSPEKQARLRVVLSNFAESLRWIALLVAPFLPKAAREIERQLGLATTEHWPSQWYYPGSQVAETGAVLFQRLDEPTAAALIDKWLTKAGAPKAEPAAEGPTAPSTAKPAEVSPTAKPAEAAKVTYDDFAKLDLRVGRILKAERVPKADKLLHLQVDIGEPAPREVVAGIATAYGPEALVGKQVVFLANLEPKKIRGILSHGMVLAAGEAEVLALSGLDREVAPGTKVK